MKKVKNIIDALPVETVLTGNTYRYPIDKVLDQGDFGITYKASVKMENSNRFSFHVETLPFDTGCFKKLGSRESGY